MPRGKAFCDPSAKRATPVSVLLAHGVAPSVTSYNHSLTFCLFLYLEKGLTYKELTFTCRTKAPNPETKSYPGW